MRVVRRELLEKIQFGQGGFLEPKEVRFAQGKVREPTLNDLADEIAAFANSRRGGEVILGVDDKCNVLGIPIDRLDAVEAVVQQACVDSIDPPVYPLIERVNLPDSFGGDRPVMRVEISSSLFVHRSPGGYFYRIGSSKRQISQVQLARLFEHRSHARLIRFDETPVPDATLGDLDEVLWKRFATSRTTDEPRQMLSKLAMAARGDDGIWRPTLAGILLASQEPHRFLPTAFVQAVAYRGKDLTERTEAAYQLDAKDITGPLDRQIADACEFVRRNMRVQARKSDAGGRVDLPQFDLLAVFEAVTNAVAHRDYSIWGSKVRLRLFDDRLELYTPGMLVGTMTPESLPYRQASRNPAIVSLLARCPIERDDIEGHRTHIMDRRGEGVPIILSRSEALSGRVPEYRLIDESELLLTIHAAG